MQEGGAAGTLAEVDPEVCNSTAMLQLMTHSSGMSSLLLQLLYSRESTGQADLGS